MTIFSNNIKRLLKDRGNILFMIIIPVILIMVVMGLSNQEVHFRIGLIDNDKTRLTQILSDNLKAREEVFEVPRGEEKRFLIDKNLDYVIDIPRGFTEGMIKGNYINIKGYSIKETNQAIPIKMIVNSFLTSIKNISSVSNKNEAKFYKGVNEYKRGNFGAEYKSLDNKSNKNAVLGGLGFLVMNMLFLSTNVTNMILKDKVSKVYYRIFSTPTSVKNYMFQNIASYLVILVIQIVLIFTFMIKIVNADFGPSIVNMFVLFFVLSLTTLSFGVLIASLSKNIQQASTLITLLNTPICMLGGCFWPIEIMPKVFQNISNFVPTTWALRGAEKLINGGNLMMVSKEILILCLFTIVFILLSSWRREDIVK